METVAHTPGPWNALLHTRYPDNGGETERVEIHGDGTEICQAVIVDSQDTDEHRAQREANARLIAAAPDLLELCQRSLQSLCDPTSDDFDVWAFAADLRAAIAKATGHA